MSLCEYTLLKFYPKLNLFPTIYKVSTHPLYNLHPQISYYESLAQPRTLHTLFYLVFPVIRKAHVMIILICPGELNNMLEVIAVMKRNQYLNTGVQFQSLCSQYDIIQSLKHKPCVLITMLSY